MSKYKFNLMNVRKQKYLSKRRGQTFQKLLSTSLNFNRNAILKFPSNMKQILLLIISPLSLNSLSTWVDFDTITVLYSM